MALINIDQLRSPETATTFNQTALNPVGNPVYWVFHTEATGNPNAKAKLLLRWGSISLPVGDSLTITSVSGSTTFVSRNNPGIYDLDPLTTAAGQALRFQQALSNHPQFKDFYTVEYSSVGLFNYVTITARFDGAQYNLDASVNLTTAGAIFKNVLQLGNSSSQGSALDSFSVVCKLFVNTQQSSKIGLTQPIAFNANDWQEQMILLEAKNDEKNNTLAIDFAQALKPFPRCPAPLLNNMNILTQPQMLVKYYFELYANYIPTGETSPRMFKIDTFGESTDEELYVIGSGMPTYTQPVHIHDNFKYFWHRLTANDKLNFLTTIPVEKPTHVDSYEFLYWVWYNIDKTRSAGLALRYNFYFEDGSSLLNQDTPITAQSRYTVFYSQVGFRKILQAFPTIEAGGSLIRKFDVRVIESIGTTGVKRDVTLPQTFVLDNTTRCTAYEVPQLLFKNAYGVFETFRFSGFYDRETQTKTSEYATNPRWGAEYSNTNVNFQQLPIDNIVYAAIGLGNPQNVTLQPSGLTTAANYNSENETTFTLRSGRISRIEMDWLKLSLFCSNEAYMINWTEVDNVGNPNQPLMRRVRFEDRSLRVATINDIFAFEINVKAGLPDNSING